MDQLEFDQYLELLEDEKRKKEAVAQQSGFYVPGLDTDSGNYITVMTSGGYVEPSSATITVSSNGTDWDEYLPMNAGEIVFSSGTFINVDTITWVTGSGIY